MNGYNSQNGVLGEYWSAQVFEAIRGTQWDIQELEKKRLEVLTAPHVVMNARVVEDGNAYCCIYGENLMEGIAAFGSTPEEACEKFDYLWRHGKRKEEPACTQD